MTDCVIFKGTIDKNGYGRISVKVGDHFHSMLAHRMAYAIAFGVDPGMFCVLHTCDTPACILPEHLFLGTQANNISDMDAKGRRSTWQRNATSCKRGHPFDDENTYIVQSTGHRRCKTCERDRQREVARQIAAILKDARAKKRIE